MSKRENLRLKLADAIERVLGTSHEYTIPNCARYVKPHLSSFSIREDTEITLEDWETAIEIATLRLAKPIPQPTILLKSRPIPRLSTDWQEPLLNRIKKLHSEGVLTEEEYQKRMSVLESSTTKEDYVTRWKGTEVISYGT